MPSVIVTSRDHAHCVTNAVESALRQEASGRVCVVVIDDASVDGTTRAVAARFGDGVTVIEKPARLGWLDSLQRALACVDDDIIAILDADCVAPPCWLRTVQAALRADTSIGIVSGPLRHGSSLAAKLLAATSHAAFVSEAPAVAAYVVDDNVAFRRDVLTALVANAPQGAAINDAVGTAWLNRELRRQRITVRYMPDLAVDHIVDRVPAQYAKRFSQSPATSVHMRRLVPSVRGARWARTRFTAAPILPAARYVQDLANLCRLREALGIGIAELPVLAALALGAEVCFGAGLLVSTAYGRPPDETAHST